MAEKLSEIEEIFQQVSAGNNFLLSGGAGSGKTYSLVQVLTQIFGDNEKAKVACITYTNVAVNQINDRVKFDNLRVSTIHDFLWDNIKSFQKNLKQSIVNLIKDEKIKHTGEENIDENYFNDKKIDYKEWKKISKGEISHDEIIVVAEYMFANYPLLSEIVKAKFDFILIDEYQDTAKEVVEILLSHFKKSNKSNIIGFFGDSMQSIYDDTIGDIKNYVSSGDVKEVLKKDNRRNPKVVIELANKLRADSLIQKQSDDQHAPNYKREGSVKFLHSQNIDITALKKTEYFKGWDFIDSALTKELYLTHNLIAPKAGFSELIAIYDKDRIIEFKNDVLKYIKENNVIVNSQATFGEVIDQVGLRPTGVKETFISENPILYNEARQYPFEIFKKIYLDKDQLIGNKKGTAEEERRKGSKRDFLIRMLFHIQECIFLYETGKYNDFLRETEFKVRSIQDKINIKEAIETLKGMKENTIEEVIDFADKSGIRIKDDRFYDFLAQKEYVFNRVKQVKYKEFGKLYDYVEGYTPFSTQHNIKGAEFENVFIILDNGNWNKYNFENLFLGKGSPSVLLRTQKLFYVCATRAKENLVIFYHNPKPEVVAKAKILFGEQNVISV